MLLFVPILFLFFPREKKKNVYPKKKKRIRLLRSASTHFVRFIGSPRFAVLDLLHKNKLFTSLSFSFTIIFVTSGSLALLDSTLRKSARDDNIYKIQTNATFL